MNAEQLNQMVKKAMARHYKRQRAKATRLLGVTQKHCTHAKTRTVTAPADQARGLALDEIAETRCDGCNRLVGFA